MRLIFFPEKQVPPRQGPLWLDDIKLVPGNNDVLDEVTQHPDFDLLCDRGIIKVVKPGKSPTINSEEETIAISDLSIDEAEGVIMAETNLEILESWRSDRRKGIKELIARRINEIKGGII